MIKYNVKTVNDWLYHSNPIKKLYYNGMVRYRRFVANGSPTPPSFDGKFKAEYSDGRSYSAACDGNAELTTGNTNPSGYEHTAMTSAIIGDCVTSIGNSAFSRCSGLTSITIPNSVTTISNSVFYGCSILSNVTIPSGVTNIGQNVFYQCSSLTSIDIPSSVTSIGNQAFQYCSSLTSCTIGSGVTTIGQKAFGSGCNNLKTVTCLATTPPTIDNSALRYTFTTTINNFYVPDESVNSYKTVWSKYSEKIKPISEKPQ